MKTDPKKLFSKPGKKEKPQAYPGLEEKMVTKPDYGKKTYKGSGKLTDKVAVITGGDSGIGRSVALAYAREGANIVLSYLPEEERDAKVIIADIQEAGRKVLAFPGNLKSETYCKKLIEKTVKEFGRIDVLVNNAALQKFFQSLEEVKSKDFQDIFWVNVTAPFLLSQIASAHMKPGSSIINTVSIQAYDPDFLLLPYATSKGALVALTKALAAEFIKEGIRVNAIAPGPIWSPLNTHGSPQEKLKKFGEKTALKRPGQPIELAPLYVLLASDEASYITGEIYGITGGEGIA